MEKSIESIWKEGFLKNNELVVPKLNDLYNQKSIHLIDQFKNKYRWNFRFLIIFSFLVLLISFPIGMKYMGIPLFFIFNGLVIFSKNHLATLADIDKNKNSYEYLKSYQTWLQERTAIIAKVYTFVYPMIFLSVIFGLWFLDLGDKGFLGNVIFNWLSEDFPGTIFIGNAPLIGVVVVLILTGMISYFSPKLYESDLQSVYGNLIKRLDELILDMEKLRQ